MQPGSDQEEDDPGHHVSTYSLFDKESNRLKITGKTAFES
jgi:hypothetical protein